MSQYQLKLTDHTCVLCHATFQAYHGHHRKYCSRKCSSHGRWLNRVRRATYTCVFCHTKFERKPSERRKYCSPQCDYRARKGKIRVSHVYTCVVCHIEFAGNVALAGYPGRNRFCSRGCYYQSLRSSTIRKCKQCGITFDAGRYSTGNRSPKTCCSMKCTNQFKTSRVTITCAHCGKDFQRKRAEARRAKFCSHRCRAKYNKLGEGTRYFQARPSNMRIPYSQPEYRKLVAQIRKRDNYQCQMCGKQFDPRTLWKSKDHLDVDHKIPIRLGGTEIPENLWSLCRPCHRKKDYRLLFQARMF